jgi:hypothetical protein
MTERSSPTPRAVGEDAALEADEGASVEAGRRLAWRPRWSVAEPRRSPWWNVPPHGHLAVESLNRWSAAAVLATMASGQGVLACVAVLDAGLGLGALGLVPLAVAVGSVLAAQFAARGIYRLGATTEGADNPPQRHQLDLSVAGGALACAVTLATAIGHLGTSGPSALGLLLLGLVTAASYTATPDGLGTTSVSPWQSVITRLYRLQEHRRSHPERCAARAREAITRERPSASCARTLPCWSPSCARPRKPPAGAEQRRWRPTPSRRSPRLVGSSRIGLSRWRGAPWRPSGYWSDVGCSTSPTASGSHDLLHDLRPIPTGHSPGRVVTALRRSSLPATISSLPAATTTTVGRSLELDKGG